ncbi:hypothetical protein BD311DRAFT_790793 [Dichomitus squalens]|uniref:MYND-type domain-containing protein n=1 Tax=Dichomitus squalens TaxID=114155 RepID=A0A4Q9MC17_9APHY|nr:hypothetical protein BD311DRAFT_790793 [Dichomitus squalens]
MNNDWGEDIVDIPIAFTCARCKNDGVSKQDLKRCGGCSVAMYCSRDCQRGDRPSHRRWCRPPVDTGAQAVNVHGDSGTLRTLVHALVCSAGGVERVLKNEECVFFRVKPLPRVTDNPATGLEITSLSLLDKHGTHLVTHSHTALYRPHFHASDCPVDDFTAAAFKDIVSLCIRCVGTGLVLHVSSDLDSVVPDAGYMVRQKKTWEWKRSEDPEALMLALISSDDVSRHTSLSVWQLSVAVL